MLKFIYSFEIQAIMILHKFLLYIIFEITCILGKHSRIFSIFFFFILEFRVFLFSSRSYIIQSTMLFNQCLHGKRDYNLSQRQLQKNQTKIRNLHAGFPDHIDMCTFGISSYISKIKRYSFETLNTRPDISKFQLVKCKTPEMRNLC